MFTHNINTTTEAFKIYSFILRRGSHFTIQSILKTELHLYEIEIEICLCGLVSPQWGSCKLEAV